MKTKIQKEEQIASGLENLKTAKTIVFADFNGTSANNMNGLRKTLHEIDSTFSVFKKRLLRVLFQKKNIDVNPEEFEGQVGVAFSNEGIDILAGKIYGFIKQAKTIKLRGGLDLTTMKFFSGEEVEMIGKLPSRDILLAQVVGTMASPMSALLYVLSERQKQVEK